MLTLAVVAVAVTAALGAARLGAGMVARARADAAADAAALAGAGRIALGDGDPCDAAEETAAANGVHMRSCTLEGVAVQVEVELEVRAAAGPPMTARGVARAETDAGATPPPSP